MSRICDSCIHLSKSKHRGRFYCEAESRDPSKNSCRDWKGIRYDRNKEKQNIKINPVIGEMNNEII